LVAGLAEELLLLLVRGEVARLVVRAGSLGRPEHVRRDAGADRAQTIGVALAVVERVAEPAGGAPGEEAVLAPPAATVARVERIEVEVAAVGIKRGTLVSRAEAVDRGSAVGQLPVNVVVALQRPVDVGVDLGDRPAPVRQAQLPDRVGRGLARLDNPRPALRGPVGAVGRAAGRDNRLERRAVIATAAAAERAAARIVEAELDLRPRLCRGESIDGAPGSDTVEDALCME